MTGSRSTAAAPREAQDGFSPIDRQLGALMGRLAASRDEAELLEISAALVSRDRGRGHSCLLLTAEAEHTVLLGERPRRLPHLAQWRQALADSHLVAVEPDEASTPRPLVLDAQNRLYLWRYWQAERRVARRLIELSNRQDAVDDLSAEGPIRDVAEDVAALWRRLFPSAASTLDWQAAAAATALSSPITLVSGGPGTGKTTTVVRLLAVLRLAQPGLRLALAAPTGKAAARLEESIAGQLGGLDGEVRDLIGEVRASTLHRLLAYSPRRDRFGRHHKSPLTSDLLVVDEASMIDLLMMDALLDALPANARLVLLGDRDQLASVDTGFVFGDLCAAAGLRLGPPFLSPRQAATYRQLGGTDSLHIRDGGRALGGRGVELQISYRFRDRPGIGALAAALREADPSAVMSVLHNPAYDEVRLLSPAETGPVATGPSEIRQTHIESVLASVGPALERYLECTTPLEALGALEAFRILCPRRRGPWGTGTLNSAVESLLVRSGDLDPAWASTAGFYRGQPILVESNDYSVQLFNGDLGVCWTEGEGEQLWVFFRDGDGVRRMALAKLPQYSTAWAMTVHKSQGTELDHVVLVLGEHDPGGLISRELLYTGITRARREVDVVASEELLRAATTRSSRRTTGLADILSMHSGRGQRLE